MTAWSEREMQDWRADRQIRQALRPVIFAIPAIALLCLLAQVALALLAMLLLDVALPGRDGQTIAGLVAMALATLGLLIGAMALRQRLLRQAARMVAFRAAPITSAQRGAEPVAADGRDMDLVRAAVVGGGVAALVDLALAPLHVGIMILLGWPMAVALLIGGLIGAALLLHGRRQIRHALDAADRALAKRDDQLQLNSDRWTAIRQLGIAQTMRDREEFAELAALDPIEMLDRAAARHRLIVAAHVAATLIVIGGLVIWRVTDDRAGMGTIAATLLLSGFALWPLRMLSDRQLELLRGQEAWRRLKQAFEQATTDAPPLPLPTPGRGVDAEGIAIAAAGERRVVLQNGTFSMKAGDITVVVGPSDTGKSMLLQALGGLAPGAIGSVRLDGATLAQYGEQGRAQHIGYMPQQCELLPGTISQNIAGFADEFDAEAVVRAAHATGAHGVIVRLPQGYDTIVGGRGCTLSQSVRQQICLARAFFGDPFLLLLDSPDSFQDRMGRAALGSALEGVRARGGIAVVVGESNAVIDAANLAMVLRKGGISDFGPKDEVRERMRAREKITNQPKPAAAAANPAE